MTRALSAYLRWFLTQRDMFQFDGEEPQLAFTTPRNSAVVIPFRR